MSKKIMLGIVAVILLVGVENLIAQERKDRPKAEPKQKGQVEQLRRQRAGEEAGRGRVEGMQQRRRLRAVREAEPERVKALQQKPQQKAVREAVRMRKRVEAVRGKLQQLRPGQVRPMQEGAGRLLDELTKAYRENDREKMGQLIRKMNQLRQRMQKARAAPGERVRDLRGRPEAAQPGAKKERPERRKATPKDTDRPGPPMLRRGMGRWGQGMQGRGIGGRGQGFQGRGMGRLGRGFQGRGIGRLGRGFQGRGMGGLGQGVPGPWCPWWRVPGPEMD
ncbi:hypothetical protein ES703_36486 [subsurface metagenome]